MITVRDACVLGVVQGLTKFLPVSSSGHLAVLHQLIAPLHATETAAIDVALHAGTLAATLLCFHRDLLALASIPAVIVSYYLWSLGILVLAGSWGRGS